MFCPSYLSFHQRARKAFAAGSPHTRKTKDGLKMPRVTTRTWRGSKRPPTPKCPHCGTQIEIEPKDYKRIDWEHLECPQFGKKLIPKPLPESVLSGVENRRSGDSLPVAFVSAAFAGRASVRFGMALFPVPPGGRGGHPSPAPTERSVQIFRTTLFRSWFTA